MGRLITPPSLYDKVFSLASSFFKKERRSFIASRIIIADSLVKTVYENDFIFIHINKTAGSSISRLLNEERHHLTALSVRDMVGEEVWNNRFKFSIVRNPWDRAVSQYHYRKENNQQNIKTDGIGFKDWLIEAFEKKNPAYINVYSMFINQYDWISDYDDNLLVDFVGKFENLGDDIKYVKEKLGIDRELPVIRKSSRNHYSGYYDEESKMIIEKYFKKDIECFNYKFESEV